MTETKEKAVSCGMSPGDLLFWEHDGTAYMLLFDTDPEPMNPRADDTPLARLFCVGSHAHLGDQGNGTELGEFLLGIIERTMTREEIANRVRTLEDEKRILIRTAAYETDDDLVNEILNEISDGELEIREVDALLEGRAVIRPVWFYEHGGITITCGDRVNQFSDSFDSGLFGWIVIDKDTVTRNLSNGNPDFDWEAIAVGRIEAEVDVYDQYLQGEVYRYALYSGPMSNADADTTDEDMWHDEDTVCGFYGNDVATNGMIDSMNVEESVKDALLDAIRNGTVERGHCKAQPVVVYTFTRDGREEA